MDELEARREGIFNATKCLFRFGKPAAQPGLKKLVQLFDFSSAPVLDLALLMHGRAGNDGRWCGRMVRGR
jgi:hypothetical protein